MGGWGGEVTAKNVINVMAIKKEEVKLMVNGLI